MVSEKDGRSLSFLIGTAWNRIPKELKERKEGLAECTLYLQNSLAGQGCESFCQVFTPCEHGETNDTKEDDTNILFLRPPLRMNLRHDRTFEVVVNLMLVSRNLGFVQMFLLTSTFVLVECDIRHPRRHDVLTHWCSRRPPIYEYHFFLWEPGTVPGTTGSNTVLR